MRVSLGQAAGMLRKVIFGVLQSALYGGISYGTGLTAWIADKAGLAMSLFDSIWISLVIGGGLGSLMTLAWPVYAKPAEAFFQRYLKFEKWLPIEQAALTYRDYLDEYGLRHAATAFDGWSKTEESKGASSCSAYFMFCVMQGVNAFGHLRVRGRPVNGRAIVEIQKPLSEGQAAYDAVNSGMIAGSDGRAYTDIVVSKSSLRDYVRWISEDERVRTQ